MSRILRIELRRSFGLATTVMVVLVGTIMLYAAPQRWAGGWMQLVTTQREYLVLLWPLAIAAGAYQARREHRSRVDELFASTSRPRLQRAAPTLGALGLTVALGYTVLIAVAAPWIWSTASYLPPTVFVVAAVGALSLVAAAWLGLAIGRLLPSPVTAPLLGVAGLGLLFPLPFALPEWLGALISPMNDMSMFHDFQTVPGRVSAAQALWMAALAGTAVVLLATRGWRTRLTALLPLVLGVGVGAAIMPRGDDYVYPLTDPVAQQLVCTSDTPKVCVGRAHEGLLPEVTPKAREALAFLAKVPGAPTTAQEIIVDHFDRADFNTRPPALPPTVVDIPVSIDREGHLAWPGRVVPRMLDNAGADGRHCEGGGAPWEVSRAVGSWLSGREPVAEPGEEAEVNQEAIVLWQGLRKLPEKEALARVTAVRQAVLTCQDASTILTRKAP
ncbi:hypothetical protein [Actinoplanes sp. NBRC 103695]|uniref:hypothetical protein n=1 Tax=Actinoplanes sp. NBRC 103695 TaxID=3032202 RepID=UPI0024A0A3B9|nr:hypothetical protein [Actinoplanes sp. NBRC 103695]GLY99012.1 hypothetical protein Acsp02_62660 [Actinoplanes sp. NBRC 103695]